MSTNNTIRDKSPQSIIAVHLMTFEIFENNFVKIVKLKKQVGQILLAVQLLFVYKFLLVPI